jgi:heme exporter protein B
MWAEILLIAGKDLRVERRSRVAINQVAPFAILVVVMFGFALEADRATLTNFTPGLYWITILLASILAIHRSVAIEAGDGASEGLLLSGLRPASVFLGKAVALIAQLLIVSIVLLGGVVVFYDARIEDAFLLVVSLIGAVLGVGAAGTLYGALLGGQRARETVLPILILPVLSPVLIAATRAFGDAMGTVAVDGWAWTSLLFGFGAVYLAMGVASHGVLMEEN